MPAAGFLEYPYLGLDYLQVLAELYQVEVLYQAQVLEASEAQWEALPVSQEPSA